MELAKDLQSRQEVRDLVAAAAAAQEQLRRMDQAAIDRITAAIAKAGSDHAAELAQLAVEETGFGNVTDKIEKNRFASQTLWQAIADMKTVGILRKDPEKQV